MRQEIRNRTAGNQVWPGDLFRVLARTVFGQRGTVWQVQSVHETPGGLQHAVLRRPHLGIERKSIAVSVLLDRRFYEPVSPDELLRDAG